MGIAASIKANAKSISRRIRDAVLADTRAKAAVSEQTAGKIKNIHNRLDIYSARMKAIAKKNRAALKAQMAATLNKIRAEESRANAALDNFGKAYAKLAADKAHFDRKLGAATNKLNMALAKQAALADGRFSKTVKDLAAARKQATAQVKQLRQDFAVGLNGVTAEAKRVATRITGMISVTTAEIATLKRQQYEVNARVKRELTEIRRVSNKRYSEAKRARGKLKLLMDENKAAASAEVKALEKSLNVKLAKARARNARNARQMKSDLRRATKKLYSKMAAWQTLNRNNSAKLSKATGAAAAA